ncbi:hypothetical protein L9F63_018781, partial [Diploptera punctata]
FVKKLKSPELAHLFCRKQMKHDIIYNTIMQIRIGEAVRRVSLQTHDKKQECEGNSLLLKELDVTRSNAS